MDTYVPPPDANNNVAVISGLVVGVIIFIIFAISLIAIFILYVKKLPRNSDTEAIMGNNNDNDNVNEVSGDDSGDGKKYNNNK